jgi:polar amino acid transport system substrate-binding protein
MLHVRASARPRTACAVPPTQEEAMHKLLIAAVVLATLLGAAEAREWTKVRIGTEGAYRPFNYIDASGQLQGFEIDLAKALCSRMKVQCEFVAQDWDGIIPALLANKYDAIMASMSITDERKRMIDFSDKYFETPAHFVVARNSKIQDVSPRTMAGKAIGAQSSTIHANYLEDEYGRSSIKLYPTQEEANLDLISGRLDAVLADKVVLTSWLESQEGQCCKFIGDDLKIGGAVGVGLRKSDQDLKAMFNKAIAEIRADGTYDKINRKYFPFSIY